MFLHIGKHEIIPLAKIVVILNAQSQFKKKNNYLLSANLTQTNNIGDVKVNSIIVMDNGDIYFSHIGPETLKKRIQKTQKTERMKKPTIKKLKKLVMK